MDDWQGCLAPECQAALVKARDSVIERGGVVITVEDFLLALLDTCPDIPRFLRSCGIDLDELVRTVQCEQPIVTEVGAEGALSSQLVDWFACSRELSDAHWLEWNLLLSVLTTGMERLRDKAYVAVLELVPNWPCESIDTVPAGIESNTGAPLVVTNAQWVALAEDVAITVSASSSSLLWIRAEPGAGKSSWLPIMLAAVNRDYLELDLRREAEVMASDLPVLAPSDQTSTREWPLLVLDNTSPSDLMLLMDRPGSLASELATNWRGPILLLGPERAEEDHCSLERRLGRSLQIVDLPESDTDQREAILTAHQPDIEKRWKIELSSPVLRFAANCPDKRVTTPGAMLEWVERAAARLDLFARCGPIGRVALAGAADTLHRQNLVALARAETPAPIADALDDIDRRQAALEKNWCERKAAGTLRRLSVADLQLELERWLAAGTGPVHYVLHCNQQDGDSAGAGSGNIHS
ncbi:hypothetical protein MYE70_12310 [Marinobacter alexandrii]|uniref:hypothetical protein n=1 Tax=Marinobacter alexandrii TaxID=2570351 RepID=UPI001FFE5519|nr:hypothetical protein [Marinobacter alexandrii]MCK2149842.1 hypothetical protein [Marinobacter alexandrii]